MQLPGFKDRSGLRRLAGIHAYIGANGSMKSMAAVADSLRSLDEGRLVYSTVHLLDPHGTAYEGCCGGAHHPGFVRLKSFSQLLEVERCDVVLDEVTGAVNARAAMGFPVQFQNLLVQLRRRDVVLRWTSPNFARADTILRGVTQAVTVCKGYLPVVGPEPDAELRRRAMTATGSTDVADAPEQAGERLWPQRRLARWTTYDARDWEEVTVGKLDKARALARQWFWRPGSVAEVSYNSLAPVEMLDHLSEAGLCAVCGGKRQHPRCSCDKEVARPRQQRPRVNEWNAPSRRGPEDDAA